MARPDDPLLPNVFTRAVAGRYGLTRGQVENRCVTGHWRVLRRGVFCTRDRWDTSDARARNLLLAEAGLVVVRTDAWVSHVSAAAAHGLVLPTDPGGAWLTRLPPGRTVYRPGLTVEAASLSEVDRRVVHGLPTTSMRRTVADCLRHCSPRDALAIADSAARSHPGITSAVARVLEDCAAWPYVARAALLLPHVDGRRESWLESWSAWEMEVAGLQRPEPQVEIHDAHGTFLGRVDFWWDEYGVAGEADGLVKYAVRPGGEPDAAFRVLVDEKRREDALRRSGVRVVRWGASDLARPQRWAREVRAELAGPSRFTGRAVSTSVGDRVARVQPWGA